MRVRIVIISLLALAGRGWAQLGSEPPPPTVIFADSGRFAIKSNRETYLRGWAGVATPGWKEFFTQAGARTEPVVKRTDGGWNFSGWIGPRETPPLSYSQALITVADTIGIGYDFQELRDVEVESVHVSLGLPAKRFAGKTVVLDDREVKLPDQPATRRPYAGRPQRIVIDSGTLGRLSIRLDEARVVWIEDRRAQGGDDFEIRIILGAGQLKIDQHITFALDMELPARAEVIAGGPGRSWQNDTSGWTRFDFPTTPLAAKPAVTRKKEKTRKTAPDDKQTTIDASPLLHAPAGKFGFLQVKAEHFVWTKGPRQKFWGVSLPASAIPPKADADAVALRLARSGANLARITFDASHAAEASDALDIFFDKLASRGIYTAFTLDWNSEASADALLHRKNSATGKRYVENPSLALVHVSTPGARDAAFHQRIYKHLRLAGVKCPIIFSNDPAGVGDAVAVEGSWDAPHRAGAWIWNRPMVRSHGGYLPDFAAASVAGKPLLVVGATSGDQNEFRAEAPLLLAAHAAMQDWDGVLCDDNTDPARLGQFPTAARVFLGGLVSPSKLTTQVVSPGNVPRLTDWLTFTSRWRNRLPGISAPDPDIVVAVGQTSEKDLPAKAKYRLAQNLGGDANKTQRLWLAAAQKLKVPLGWEEGGGREFASDNGQLAWDQDRGRFTILTPSCRAAVGFIGGQSQPLGDVTIDAGPPMFAAVSLVALDGEPIAGSNRMLLTAVARCENINQQWIEGIDDDVCVTHAEPGTLIEPVRAIITFHRKAPLRAYALDAAGHRRRELAVGRATDGYALTVTGESLSYEIVTDTALRLWPFGK